MGVTMNVALVRGEKGKTIPVMFPADKWVKYTAQWHKHGIKIVSDVHEFTLTENKGATDG